MSTPIALESNFSYFSWARHPFQSKLKVIWDLHCPRQTYKGPSLLFLNGGNRLAPRINDPYHIFDLRAAKLSTPIALAHISPERATPSKANLK